MGFLSNFLAMWPSKSKKYPTIKIFRNIKDVKVKDGG